MRGGGKLSRYTGLRRFARLPQVRTEPRRGPVLDAGYLARVRELGCAAMFVQGHECSGRIHAHHAGPRGLGQKADDSTAIPLCMVAHSNWHDANGCFAGWGKERRSEWAAAQIEITRAVLRQTGGTLVETIDITGLANQIAKRAMEEARAIIDRAFSGIGGSAERDSETPIILPPGGRAVSDKTIRMVDALRNGTPNAVVARKFGVSQQRVSQLRTRYGLPKRAYRKAA